MTHSDTLQTSDRSKLKRSPRRGNLDRAVINQILDEALVVHVGFVTDGQPFVIPMAFGRDRDKLYLHGATTSRMMQTLEQGVDVCVTTTLLDGLVIARSLFHHAMNYRSVVLFGQATLVTDAAEKTHALQVLSNHITPGQWEQARQPTPQELKITTVLAFPIIEGTAKIREGAPIDEPADYTLPVWAGEIPLKLTAGEPIPDAKLAADIPLPNNLAYYQRGKSFNVS